jgi:hypothetical protein
VGEPACLKHQWQTKRDYKSRFTGTIGESIRCKKASEIIDEINDTVNQWKKFADNVDVSPKLRNEIAKTLLNLKH